MPTAGSLPVGVQGGAVRWDERTAVATKRWQSPATSTTGLQDVWVSIGPAAGIAAGAPVPSRRVQQVDLGGVVARVWHGGGPYDVVVVRFPRGAETVEVRTVHDKTEHDTVTAAMRIARSIRGRCAFRDRGSVPFDPGSFRPRPSIREVRALTARPEMITLTEGRPARRSA